jgi:hypothetical protein
MVIALAVPDTVIGQTQSATPTVGETATYCLAVDVPADTYVTSVTVYDFVRGRIGAGGIGRTM